MSAWHVYISMSCGVQFELIAVTHCVQLLYTLQRPLSLHAIVPCDTFCSIPSTVIYNQCYTYCNKLFLLEWSSATLFLVWTESIRISLCIHATIFIHATTFIQASCILHRDVDLCQQTVGYPVVQVRYSNSSSWFSFVCDFHKFGFNQSLQCFVVVKDESLGLFTEIEVYSVTPKPSKQISMNILNIHHNYQFLLHIFIKVVHPTKYSKI